MTITFEGGLAKIFVLILCATPYIIGKMCSIKKGSSCIATRYDA